MKCRLERQGRSGLIKQIFLGWGEEEGLEERVGGDLIDPIHAVAEFCASFSGGDEMIVGSGYFPVHLDVVESFFKGLGTYTYQGGSPIFIGSQGKFGFGFDLKFGQGKSPIEDFINWSAITHWDRAQGTLRVAAHPTRDSAAGMADWYWLPTIHGDSGSYREAVKLALGMVLIKATQWSLQGLDKKRQQVVWGLAAVEKHHASASNLLTTILV